MDIWVSFLFFQTPQAIFPPCNWLWLVNKSLRCTASCQRMAFIDKLQLEKICSSLSTCSYFSSRWSSFTDLVSTCQNYVKISYRKEWEEAIWNPGLIIRRNRIIRHLGSYFWNGQHGGRPEKWGHQFSYTLYWEVRVTVGGGLEWGSHQSYFCTSLFFCGDGVYINIIIIDYIFNIYLVYIDICI